MLSSVDELMTRGTSSSAVPEAAPSSPATIKTADSMVKPDVTCPQPLQIHLWGRKPQHSNLLEHPSSLLPRSFQSDVPLGKEICFFMTHSPTSASGFEDH